MQAGGVWAELGAKLEGSGFALYSTATKRGIGQAGEFEAANLAAFRGTAAGSETMAAKVRGSTGLMGGAMSKFARVASVAFIGGWGATALVSKMIDLAGEQATANIKLQTVTKNMTGDYKGQENAVTSLIRKQSQLSGFTRTELTSSYADFYKVAHGKAKPAMDMLIASTELARLKGWELSKSQQVVTKAGMGLVGILRRQGIQIDPVTKNMDALTMSGEKYTVMQKRAAKAADLQATSTYAVGLLLAKNNGILERYNATPEGKIEKRDRAVKEMLLSMGKVAIPMVDKLIDRFAAWAQKMADTGQAARWMKEAITIIEQVARAVEQISKGLNRVARLVGGWKNAIELMFGLWALNKITKIVTAIGGISNNIMKARRSAASPILITAIVGWEIGKKIGNTKAAAEIRKKIGLDRFGDWFLNKIGKGTNKTDAETAAILASTKDPEEMAKYKREHQSSTTPTLHSAPDKNDTPAVIAARKARAKDLAAQKAAEEARKDRAAAAREALMRGDTPYDTAYSKLEYQLARAGLTSTTSDDTRVKKQMEASLMQQLHYLQQKTIGAHGKVLDALYSKMTQILGTYKSIADELKSNNNEVARAVQNIRDSRKAMEGMYGSSAKVSGLINQQYFANPADASQADHYARRMTMAINRAAGDAA